jgi:Cytochrome P460
MVKNAANHRGFAADALAAYIHRVQASPMVRKMKIALFALITTVCLVGYAQKNETPANGPEYTSDGQLKLPQNYREWVYLTTGFDMSYNPAMRMGHHMFDNVFVNPEAYQAFLKTGTWPDKTVMVLEGRMAQSNGSINKAGNYQGTDVMAIEVHVKDEAHFAGKWAFFPFDDAKTAKMIPTTADCYSCHKEHGAVDTTFVQFYPTLLPVAKAKGTAKNE